MRERVKTKDNQVSEQRIREVRKTNRLFKRLMNAWATPPELTVSQWADTKRRLASETSAEPGQWRTDRAPYQREIMDAVSDPSVETVVLETSSQVGKTETLLNTLGYHIDYDPAPILYVLPTDEMAKDFSKERLTPTINICPSLASKVSDSKSRNSGNTISNKKFPGGYLALIGANAPSQLSSRPIRILLCDEVDRFPVSAGVEGDPVNLAIKRTTTFWNRKIILAGTPTIKGASRIEAEYETSSKEELHVACPDCGEYQPYVWAQLKFEHESGTLLFKMIGYQCRECGCIEPERLWKKQPVKWVAEHPEITRKRGFHLNELASPWKTWDKIVQDFLEAKKGGKETLKVWTNTSLGLSWEEEGDLDIEEILLKRRQYYHCEVPKDVLVLTCGVDVQDNRLEYEIIGWGLDKTSWGIQYGVLMGDPGQLKVWKMLDDVLFRTYKRSDGLVMQIMTTCIDSGGHHTEEVYKYCRKNEARRVWAIKGQGGSGVPFIQRPKKRNASGAWLFMIGVDVGKDTLASRLKVAYENEPGFCHFPMESAAGYDQQYFLGLTAEKRLPRTVNGKTIINWVLRRSGARNEPFDIRNYATAALEILNPQLEMLHKRLNSGDIPGNSTPSPPKKPTKKGTKSVEIW